MQQSRRAPALTRKREARARIVAMPLWQRLLHLAGLTVLGAVGALVVSTLVGGPRWGAVLWPALGIALGLGWQYLVAPRRWAAEAQRGTSAQ